MKRFAVSGTYTAAFFLASLFVTVLVVRLNGIEAQARFFYFQAIFYVFSTVVSQSLTLNVFQNTSLLRAGLVIDAAAFVSVVAFLAVSRKLGFSLADQLSYAAATVLLYRGSAQMIAVQFHSRNAVSLLWVPLMTLILRVIAAWGFSGYGPAPMFLANGLVAFAVPSMVLLSGFVKPDPDRAAPETGQRGTQAAIFVFFLIGAFTFQWERVLYGILDAQESLVVTGYVMTVVLPPLSSLFATLYRGEARGIFVAQDNAQQWRRFVRVGGAYMGLSLAYLAVLLIFWPQVMGLIGAAVEPPITLAVTLGVAILVDRLANLLVFLGQDNGGYRWASIAKGIMLPVAFIGALAFGFDRPLANYSVFLVIALAYLAIIAAKRA